MYHPEPCSSVNAAEANALKALGQLSGKLIKLAQLFGNSFSSGARLHPFTQATPHGDACSPNAQS
eukprot:3630836-Pyramimonas_sp.AAC.1